MTTHEWTLESALRRIEELEADLVKAAEMGEQLLEENEELSQEILDLKAEAVKNDKQSPARKSVADVMRRSIHNIKEKSGVPSVPDFDPRKSIRHTEYSARDSTASNDMDEDFNGPRPSAGAFKKRQSTANLFFSMRDAKKSSAEESLEQAIMTIESMEIEHEEERNQMKGNIKSLQQQFSTLSDQHEDVVSQFNHLKEAQSKNEQSLEMMRTELLQSKDLVRTALVSCKIAVPNTSASSIVPGEFRELIRLLSNTTLDFQQRASHAEEAASHAVKGASSEAQTASNSRALLEQMTHEATEELGKFAARNEALEQQLEETQKLLAAEHERLLNARRRLVYLAGKADPTDLTAATELINASAERMDDPSGISQQLENARRALEVAEAQNDVLHSQISDQNEQMRELKRRLAHFDPSFVQTEIMDAPKARGSTKFASSDLLSALGRVNADEKKNAMSLLHHLGHRLNVDDSDDDSSDYSSSDDESSDHKSSEKRAEDVVNSTGGQPSEALDAVKRTQEAFSTLQKDLSETRSKLERAQKEAKAFKVLWADCAAQLDEVKHKLRMLESQVETERVAKESALRNNQEMQEQRKRGGFRAFMARVKAAVGVDKKKETNFRVVEACVVDTGVHSNHTDKSKPAQVSSLQMKLDFADFHEKEALRSARGTVQRDSNGIPISNNKNNNMEQAIQVLDQPSLAVQPTTTPSLLTKEEVNNNHANHAHEASSVSQNHPPRTSDNELQHHRPVPSNRSSTDNTQQVSMGARFALLKAKVSSKVSSKVHEFKEQREKKKLQMETADFALKRPSSGPNAAAVHALDVSAASSPELPGAVECEKLETRRDSIRSEEEEAEEDGQTALMDVIITHHKTSDKQKPLDESVHIGDSVSSSSDSEQEDEEGEGDLRLTSRASRFVPRTSFYQPQLDVKQPHPNTSSRKATLGTLQLEGGLTEEAPAHNGGKVSVKSSMIATREDSSSSSSSRSSSSSAGSDSEGHKETREVGRSRRGVSFSANVLTKQINLLANSTEYISSKIKIPEEAESAKTGVEVEKEEKIPIATREEDTEDDLLLRPGLRFGRKSLCASAAFSARSAASSEKSVRLGRFNADSDSSEEEGDREIKVVIDADPQLLRKSRNIRKSIFAMEESESGKKIFAARSKKLREQLASTEQDDDFAFEE